MRTYACYIVDMNTPLAPNAEIRVKSVNGRPAFALTNDKAEAKFVFKCGFCKKNHQIWLPASFHTVYRQVVPHHGWASTVITHINTCPEAQAKFAAWIAEGKMTTERLSKYLENHVQTYSNYFPVAFNWIDRGDGGHVCNAKCMGACGKVCECRCRGRNHGEN